MEQNNIIEGVALNSTIVSGNSNGKKPSKKGKKKAFQSQQKVNGFSGTLVGAPKKKSKKKDQEKLIVVGGSEVQFHQSQLSQIQMDIEMQKRAASVFEAEFNDDIDEEQFFEESTCVQIQPLYLVNQHSNPLVKNKGGKTNAKLPDRAEVEELKGFVKFMEKSEKLNRPVLSCRVGAPNEYAELDDDQDVLPIRNPTIYMNNPIEEAKNEEDEDDDNDNDDQGPQTQKKYVLQVNFSQLTLHPAAASDDDELKKSTESLDLGDSDDGGDAASDVLKQKKILEKTKYNKEMNKLYRIEHNIFKKKNSAVQNQPQVDTRHLKMPSVECFRTETADFPMKLVTHGLIEESKDSSPLGSGDVSIALKKQGTPRFPTDEEIETEERRLLLSFAFKDQNEIEQYRKDMNNIIGQEFIVERPPESKYREIKYQLRRFEPSNKKTLVFCGIDCLFMFSSQAHIVKQCDRQVTIRKDGIKRHYKIFFRPHLYTFLKTLSQYFELALYLNEEERVVSQWVKVLNSFNDENFLKFNGKMEAAGDVKQGNQSGLKLAIKKKQTLTEKFFDIILTREHCILDKQTKVACRNKDLLLEGRSLKNIVFFSYDLKDSMLVHQNAINVRPYHGNKYENTLAKLKIYLLKHILDCADVRDVIRRDFLVHLKTPQQL